MLGYLFAVSFVFTSCFTSFELAGAFQPSKFWRHSMLQSSPSCFVRLSVSSVRFTDLLNLLAVLRHFDHPCLLEIQFIRLDLRGHTHTHTHSVTFQLSFSIGESHDRCFLSCFCIYTNLHWPVSLSFALRFHIGPALTGIAWFRPPFRVQFSVGPFGRKWIPVFLSNRLSSYHVFAIVSIMTESVVA